MAQDNPNSLANLKPPFSKGHEPLAGCGRPKGSKTITDALRKLLNASAKKLPLKGEIAEIAEQFGVTDVREVLALRTVLLAFSKSPSASLAAIKEATDRTEGQSKQNIAITEKVDDAIKLNEQQLQDIYEGRADFEDVLESAESASGDIAAEDEATGI
jgi:hypothetical protein